MSRYKEMRERAGLSVIEVAKHYGITRQTVYAWEHGKASPRSDMLTDIAKMYGCTVGELLGE